MMLFPDALLNSPLFGIGLTVILYAISEIIIDRFSLNIIPPSLSPALWSSPSSFWRQA